MKKYPKPKLFKPTLEDQKRVASKIAKQLPKNKAVGLTDGSQVRGTNYSTC